MSTIVGLTGFKGVGKDTAAAGLRQRGYRQVNFADPLRAMLLAMNPLIEIRYGEPVRLSTLVATHGWDDAKAIPDVRRLLQRLGTEGGRNILSANVWVDKWRTDVACLPARARVVTTDVRFPNEAQAIRQLGGYIIRIESPSVTSDDGHASETVMGAIMVDGTIVNDHLKGDAFDLRCELAAMVDDLNRRRLDLPAGLPPGVGKSSLEVSEALKGTGGWVGWGAFE